MKTSLFDYALPDELIAKHPPEARDAGRLLVLGRDGLLDHVIRDLPRLVPEGALLVLNDTRVFRARLVGERRGGGRFELLLLRRLGEAGAVERWECFAKPAKRLHLGTRYRVGELELVPRERTAGGELVVELAAEAGVESAISREGHVPIPPYLGREDEPADAERYQTVFAAHTGSVAAPTAGLHLTRALLDELVAHGIELAYATLHVGAGTFKPVSTDDLDQHAMHAEELELGSELVASVERARARRSPVVAVGTTVVRALESGADPENPGLVRAGRMQTRLLIQPGYRFAVVDALLTNFHLPKSTLLALVAAFAGLERVQAAYRTAVARRYRFLSYGDAMWIPERAEP